MRFSSFTRAAAVGAKLFIGGIAILSGGQLEKAQAAEGGYAACLGNGGQDWRPGQPTIGPVSVEGNTVYATVPGVSGTVTRRGMFRGRPMNIVTSLLCVHAADVPAARRLLGQLNAAKTRELAAAGISIGGVRVEHPITLDNN